MAKVLVAVVVVRLGMKAMPAEVMQRKMKTLTDDLARAYAEAKAKALPTMLATRFEPGNQRYGIPSNAPSTTADKMRRTGKAIPLVDSGILRSSMRLAYWRVSEANNLSTRLPAYAVELLRKGYDFISLTTTERANLAAAAKEAAKQQRVSATVIF